MVCNVLACIWKWGFCLFKGFFSLLIIYKDISHKCLQFVCLTFTHSWRKLINWCQGAILHHSSFPFSWKSCSISASWGSHMPKLLPWKCCYSQNRKVTSINWQEKAAGVGKLSHFWSLSPFSLLPDSPFAFQSCGLESWQEEQNSPTSKELRSTMIPHWTGCEESDGDAIICIFPNSNLKLLLDTVIYLVGRSVVGTEYSLSNQDGCIL